MSSSVGPDVEILSASAPRPVQFANTADAVRVVIVEDDEDRRETLEGKLSDQGFLVQSFADDASFLKSPNAALDADVVLLNGRVVDLIDKSCDTEMLVGLLKRIVRRSEPPSGPMRDGELVCGKLILRPNSSRTEWDGRDVGLTLGEYNIVHLLASKMGQYLTYRAIYDRLRYEGFVAGSGQHGYRANVRAAITRIRNKFRACDPTFAEIQNYTGFGYCWRKTPG